MLLQWPCLSSYKSYFPYLWKLLYRKRKLIGVELFTRTVYHTLVKKVKKNHKFKTAALENKCYLLPAKLFWWKNLLFTNTKLKHWNVMVTVIVISSEYSYITVLIFYGSCNMVTKCAPWINQILDMIHELFRNWMDSWYILEQYIYISWTVL